MNEYQDQSTWWDIEYYSVYLRRWVSLYVTFDTEQEATRAMNEKETETLSLNKDFPYRVRQVYGRDD